MIEDEAAEKLKKRARDMGLIVNTGADRKPGTIASQTKTTKKLDASIKRAAEDQMASKKKGGKRRA
jgi:hypothetical protein